MQEEVSRVRNDRGNGSRRGIKKEEINIRDIDLSILTSVSNRVTQLRVVVTIPTEEEEDDSALIALSENKDNNKNNRVIKSITEDVSFGFTREMPMPVRKFTPNETFSASVRDNKLAMSETSLEYQELLSFMSFQLTGNRRRNCLPFGMTIIREEDNSDKIDFVEMRRLSVSNVTRYLELDSLVRVQLTWTFIDSPFRLGGRGGAGYWGGVKGGGCGDTRAGEEVVEPWMEGTAGISVVVSGVVSGVVDVIVVVAAVGVNGDVVVVAMMVLKPTYPLMMRIKQSSDSETLTKLFFAIYDRQSILLSQTIKEAIALHVVTTKKYDLFPPIRYIASYLVKWRVTDSLLAIKLFLFNGGVVAKDKVVWEVEDAFSSCAIEVNVKDAWKNSRRSDRMVDRAASFGELLPWTSRDTVMLRKAKNKNRKKNEYVNLRDIMPTSSKRKRRIIVYGLVARYGPQSVASAITSTKISKNYTLNIGERNSDFTNSYNRSVDEFIFSRNVIEKISVETCVNIKINYTMDLTKIKRRITSSNDSKNSRNSDVLRLLRSVSNQCEVAPLCKVTVQLIPILSLKVILAGVTQKIGPLQSNVQRLIPSKPFYASQCIDITDDKLQVVSILDERSVQFATYKKFPINTKAQKLVSFYSTTVQTLIKGSDRFSSVCCEDHYTTWILSNVQRLIPSKPFYASQCIDITDDKLQVVSILDERSVQFATYFRYIPILGRDMATLFRELPQRKFPLTKTDIIKYFDEQD
ncbi:hypothetical protein WN51_07533 [Melipona quadrifasciata]|uniref:Uncharacterized protein n=1 Tax=Melipona quadrifasciata TaxID=166423 RepID=A0A0N0BJ94_9HYME|nr:hypothetical protein WN51_07533 [Melipona quadrifasciata]